MTGETWDFAESKEAPQSSHIPVLNGIRGLRHFYPLLTGSPGRKAQEGWILGLLQENTQRSPVMMGIVFCPPPRKKNSKYLGNISVVCMRDIVKT